MRYQILLEESSDQFTILIFLYSDKMMFGSPELMLKLHVGLLKIFIRKLSLNCFVRSCASESELKMIKISTVEHSHRIIKSFNMTFFSYNMGTNNFRLFLFFIDKAIDYLMIVLTRHLGMFKI